MIQNPPKDMPRIPPYLYYNNLPSAMEWVSVAFGLHTRLVVNGPDGFPMHGEVTLKDGVVMMGKADPERGGRSPIDTGAASQGLYVYVDDVDAHCAGATAAGATIVMALEETFWGDRIYAAVDPEGHHWTFAQHVKDIAPEEMTP
ncbi:MAG: VOC family protein [Desulfobacterales bacterium]|jgi:uncharacterized glyoxalase superfamily protein PhnB